MLKSEPKVLSKPEPGWANNHTFVDEGPFALPAENKLFLTFSAAAVDTSYVVGLLQTRESSWAPFGTPTLSSRFMQI